MRKKLLLADDSITIQKVVELTFPSDEFEVVTAGNGRLAVDKAMTFLPDVVLCDVIMPQLDGYQVCEALRASPQLKDVPILLLNGAFEPYDAERATAVGALGNVSKPFDPPALVARVKAILAERATAAFERPTEPMPLEAIAAHGGATEPPAEPQEAHQEAHEEAYDEAKTVDIALPALEMPHASSYDESETHPVSTVEVPMGIRELAARSLTLDAPVFAHAEPEVLAAEDEPSDFSETLHGPLVLEDPMPTGEEVSEVETAAVEHIEEIETMEEVLGAAASEEIAATEVAEIEAPHADPGVSEFEFDADAAATGEQVANTEPPATGEFAGDHEFAPDELEAPTSEADAPESALTATLEPLEEPSHEPMAPLPEELAPPEPMAMPAASPRPAPPVAPPPPPQPAKSTPAPVKTAAPGLADPGSFADLGPPLSTPPIQGPSAQAAAPAMLPSAEVAVPMDMVQQIAQRVISQVSERIIREIAWDVIPGLAEKLIKAEIERIKARAESERD